MAGLSGGWSEAPDEVLSRILELLTVADRIRFGGVCVSWRSAAAEKPRRPPLQSPWLAFPGPGKDTDTVSSFCFFSLFERREYRMVLPMIGGRPCIGSSEGWLIWADNSADLHMLHPISSTHIALPPSATLLNVKSVSIYWKAWKEHIIDILRSGTIYYRDFKVVLSPCTRPGSYAAVGIFHQKLAFARSGDASWTTVEECTTCFGNLVFHNQIVYAMDFKGQVWSCDTRNSSPPMISPVGSKLEPHFYYMLMSSGELLVVKKNKHYFPTEGEYRGGPLGSFRTIGFQVFKFDSSSNNWGEVKNLGDHALFLKRKNSFSLSKRDIPELQVNSIYIIEDGKIKCFSLEKGFEEIYCLDSEFVRPRPVWFTPTLL